MLSDALSFPTEGEDLARPYLIGSGLLLGSFVVGITIIPLYGYYLRVIDAGRTGAPTLPAFEDWEALLVDGIKMFAVNFLYAGVPGVLFFGAGFFTLFAVGLGAAAESAVFLLLMVLAGGLVTLVTGVLWLVGSFVSPAALAHMRAEGEFEAAFQVRTILGLAASSDYIVAVLLALVVGGAISMVGVMLSFLLVGLPVLFFGGIVTFHLYGQGYRAAREAKHGPSGDTAPQPEPV